MSEYKPPTGWDSEARAQGMTQPEPRTAVNMRCFNCGTPYGGVHPAHARLVADGVMPPCEAEASRIDVDKMERAIAAVAKENPTDDPRKRIAAAIAKAYEAEP